MQTKEIKGWYYINDENINCRKYLDIKLNSLINQNPDLTVIMMNPGSSFPLDYNDDGRELTLANPDPTQDQIIWFMNQKGYSFARILNLSDIRDQESDSFYTNISKDENANTHSLFHPTHRSSLKNLYNLESDILIGWGVNKKLLPLINLVNQFMQENINSNIIHGWLKPGTTNFYYHPQPRFDKTNGQKWRDNFLNKKRKVR